MDTKRCFVYGLGNLGRLFAGGALRAAYTVSPITREINPADALREAPLGTPLLLGVSESALQQVVPSIPPARLPDTIWLQNGLSPALWRGLLPEGVPDPTILTVWTNCKPSSPLLIGRPSRVFGPHAAWVCEVHRQLHIPCLELSSYDALCAELAAKDAFILTVNALGVLHNQTLGAWMDAHPARVHDLLRDSVKLALARTPAPHADLEHIAEQAFDAMRAMPTLGTRGRTAFERVQHAVEDAKKFSVALDVFQREGLLGLNAFK